MAWRITQLSGLLRGRGATNTEIIVADGTKDLPVQAVVGSIAVVHGPTSQFFMFDEEGLWTQYAPITSILPIHSVYWTDAEDLDPNILLGFGTWVGLGKIPSKDVWGWKRTA